MGILDLLFPKYCVNCRKLGSYLCPNCFAYISFDDSGTCLICLRASIDGVTHPACRSRYAIDAAFASIAYKGVVKKLIYSFKYKPYLTDLKTVLGDLFYESLIQQEGFTQILEMSPVLVPIPLHSSKLKSRGYNHAQILASQLAKRLNLQQADLLKRVKKTASQFGLKREERRINVAGAFAVSPNVLLSQYPNIFLVDDILTTGATLLEAANVLKRAGARRVWGIALARD